MSGIDQAKQILYLEENRAYRNAFNVEIKPAEIGETVSEGQSTPTPVLDECCEDFNSRVEYAPNHLWNGS